MSQQLKPTNQPATLAEQPIDRQLAVQPDAAGFFGNNVAHTVKVAGEGSELDAARNQLRQVRMVSYGIAAVFLGMIALMIGLGIAFYDEVGISLFIGAAFVCGTLLLMSVAGYQAVAATRRRVRRLEEAQGQRK